MINTEVVEQAVEKFDGKVVQGLEEFSEWLTIVEKLEPKVGLEVGTFMGGTAYLTLELIPSLEIFVTVDINHKRCSYEHSKLRKVSKDSRLLSTRDRVVEVLKGKQVDFLFIDGLHTMHGVMGDFYSYGSLVRKGGLIGFHDTMVGRLRASHTDVLMFWTLLCNLEVSRVQEIGINHGIGVYER